MVSPTRICRRRHQRRIRDADMSGDGSRAVTNNAGADPDLPGSSVPRLRSKKSKEGRCWGDWTAQVLLVSRMLTSQDDAPKCREQTDEEYDVGKAPLALPQSI